MKDIIYCDECGLVFTIEELTFSGMAAARTEVANGDSATRSSAQSGLPQKQTRRAEEEKSR